jgi:hypothetical protein
MRQMKSDLSILTVLVLVRLKSYLRLAGVVASRIAIFRLGLFVFEAARFRLASNGLLKRPRRAAVLLTEAGEQTLDVAPVLIVAAEMSAHSRGVEEIWYELATTPDSKTIEVLPDLFALVYLSSMARFFSITLREGPRPHFEGLESLDNLFERSAGGASRSSCAARLLSDRPPHPTLGKPFYQSEIALNDYLKRAANGRTVVLVAVSEANFDSCWRQILHDMNDLFEKEADSLFMILDHPSIPPENGLPMKLSVQPLGVLGFTGLERLALARSVDFLVTDHAPYVLSALSGSTAILVPQIAEQRGAATGVAQRVEFRKRHVGDVAT